MVSFQWHPLYSPFCKLYRVVCCLTLSKTHPLILFGLFLHFGLDFYFILSQFGHLLALPCHMTATDHEGWRLSCGSSATWEICEANCCLCCVTHSEESTNCPLRHTVWEFRHPQLSSVAVTYRVSFIKLNANEFISKSFIWVFAQELWYSWKSCNFGKMLVSYSCSWVCVNLCWRRLI